MEEKAPEPWLAMQVVMMPADANAMPTKVTLPDGSRYPFYATIFGGVILSHIDMAGSVGARREAILAGGPDDAVFVTVAINRVEFKEPVLVGDVVRFMTRLVKIGRTSVTVNVAVEAERVAERIPVTEAELVYVRVDENRRPIPVLTGKSI